MSPPSKDSSRSSTKTSATIPLIFLDLTGTPHTINVDPTVAPSFEKLRQLVARRWKVPDHLVAIQHLNYDTAAVREDYHVLTPSKDPKQDELKRKKGDARIDFDAIRSAAYPESNGHFRVIVKQVDPFYPVKLYDSDDEESAYVVPPKAKPLTETDIGESPQRGSGDHELAWLLSNSFVRGKEFLHLYPNWAESLTFLCYLLRNPRNKPEIAKTRLAAALVDSAPNKSNLFDSSLLSTPGNLNNANSAVVVSTAGGPAAQQPRRASGSLLGVEKRLSAKFGNDPAEATISDTSIFLRMYEIYAPTVLVAVLSNPLFRQYNWNVRALGSREPSKQLLVRSFGVAESGKTRYGKHVSQEERGDILLTLVKNCAMKSPATVLNYCALPSEKFLAYKNPHDPNSRTRELAIPRSTLAPLFELKFLWPVVHLLLTKREDCVQVRTLFAPDLFAGWSPFCACLCRGDSQLRLRMMAFLKKHGPLQLRSTTANFWAKVEAFAKDLFDQVQQELRERADVTKEIPLDMPDFALEKTDGGGGAINLSREVSSEVSTTRPASPGEQEVTEGGVENNSTAKGIIGEETEAVEKNEEQAVVELQGAAENECLSDEDEPEEVQQNRLTGKWWSSRRMPALDFGACDRGSYVRDKEGYNLEMSRDEGVWQIVSFRLWISLAYLWQPKPEKRPITFRSLLAMEVSDSD